MGRCSPPSSKRLNELEAAGLFGKGEVWERGRYPAEYANLASGALAGFLSSTVRGPTQRTTRWAGR